MGKSTLATFFLALFISPLSHAQDSVEKEIAQACQKTPQYGKMGRDYYDKKHYSKALEQFEYQAAWLPFCAYNQEQDTTRITDNDIAISQNNVGLTHAKLNHPLWARAWFKLSPESKTSQFNLSQLPTPTITKDLSGDYVDYSGFGQWNYITVDKNKKTKQYDVSFSGVYMGLRSLIYGPNMGQFDINMPLNKTQAHYQYEQCRINLAFEADPKQGQFVKVTQEGEGYNCGFGHNVNAVGTYYKVERIKKMN